MTSILTQLTAIVSAVVTELGYDAQYGEVVLSNRPDLSQFQCNGALAAAKRYGRNPRELAQEIADRLQSDSHFREVSLAGPGFINLTVTDAFLVDHIRQLAADNRWGYTPVTRPERILVDYGGANVAKPMHIGHLRTAIIGESLKRLTGFV
ncbi:MAG: arginine--tRNA ligase, partial [Caldilineaceae bacterium]|nr:arginine--tRNA ligase [Caldilineaceae bacterium]